jgi:hypothetical protein
MLGHIADNHNILNDYPEKLLKNKRNNSEEIE